jgi:hypothetical protein
MSGEWLKLWTKLTPWRMCGKMQSHPKFAGLKDIAPLLFSRTLQKGEEKLAKKLSLGEAVAQKIIANETLAYFIGRTYLFMVMGKIFVENKVCVAFEYALCICRNKRHLMPSCFLSCAFELQNYWIEAVTLAEDSECAFVCSGPLLAWCVACKSMNDVLGQHSMPVTAHTDIVVGF